MDGEQLDIKIIARLAAKKLSGEFKESEHKRAGDGKFGSGPGKAAPASKSKAAPAKGSDAPKSGDSPYAAADKPKVHDKDIEASKNVVAGAIPDAKFDKFNAAFTKDLQTATVGKISPETAKKVFTAHKYTFDSDPDNEDMHKRGKENRGKTVTDPSVLIKYGDKVYALDGQHRLNAAIDRGEDARVVILDGSKYEKFGLNEKFFEGRTQREK